jgi:hypothetical protein
MHNCSNARREANVFVRMNSVSTAINRGVARAASQASSASIESIQLCIRHSGGSDSGLEPAHWIPV